MNNMPVKHRSVDGIESPFNGDNIPFKTSILNMNLKSSTKLIFPKSYMEIFFEKMMEWDFG